MVPRGPSACQSRPGGMVHSRHVCYASRCHRRTRMKYKGIICLKHPELDGMRSKGSHKCLKCLSEARKVSRARDVKKHGSKVIGKICPIHARLGGLRYTSSRRCVGCHNCLIPYYKLTVE